MCTNHWHDPVGARAWPCSCTVLNRLCLSKPLHSTHATNNKPLSHLILHTSFQPPSSAVAHSTVHPQHCTGNHSVLQQCSNQQHQLRNFSLRLQYGCWKLVKHSCRVAACHLQPPPSYHRDTDTAITAMTPQTHAEQNTHAHRPCSCWAVPPRDAASGSGRCQPHPGRQLQGEAPEGRVLQVDVGVLMRVVHLLHLVLWCDELKSHHVGGARLRQAHAQQARGALQVVQRARLLEGN
mmetsp:Transcript_5156/g.12676  ORF Transcript_5156/g.12676 Transcript_5156/m.12676 type:complete len:237 (+) Transcript_5156:18-728(+)